MTQQATLCSTLEHVCSNCWRLLRLSGPRLFGLSMRAAAKASRILEVGTLVTVKVFHPSAPEDSFGNVANVPFNLVCYDCVRT